jgi:hypothetical protein
VLGDDRALPLAAMIAVEIHNHPVPSSTQLMRVGRVRKQRGEVPGPRRVCRIGSHALPSELNRRGAMVGKSFAAPLCRYSRSTSRIRATGGSASATCPRGTRPRGGRERRTHDRDAAISHPRDPGKPSIDTRRLERFQHVDAQVVVDALRKLGAHAGHRPE